MVKPVERALLHLLHFRCSEYRNSSNGHQPSISIFLFKTDLKRSEIVTVEQREEPVSFTHLTYKQCTAESFLIDFVDGIILTGQWVDTPPVDSRPL